ncbi:hypothetical protein BZA05DRAFT_473442 [Tricharina praecox]|uniref:uncharacterized protein n=1 Tax=Tricharina praecox TaxID=43433 RepID=UPI002220CD33|nr:uncharacterized protein BZA05DRAFT_473442 [Tricharina praecox]KAI5853365.1 hypothetical protein BZA05DRAFT_473442 [Tricharina praecox]
MATSSHCSHDPTSTRRKSSANSTHSLASAHGPNFVAGDLAQYYATYSITNAHLLELPKGYPGLKYPDILYRLFQRVGVKLLSITSPEYDPDTSTNNHQIRVCAKDSRTLLAAITALREMGLPFKELDDIKLSEIHSLEDTIHAVNDSGRARPDDKDNRQPHNGQMPDPVGGFQGLHSKALTKSQQAVSDNPWLTADYDVFTGRSRSRSIPGPSSFMSAEVREEHGMTVLSRLLKSSIRLKSPQQLEPDSQQSCVSSTQGMDDYQVPPPTPSPSKALGITVRSVSDEYPTIARYMKMHGKHPTDEGASTTAVRGNNEWNRTGHPDSTAQTKEKYCVPQRRMSDHRGRPMLRIDTAIATTNAQPATAPARPTESHASTTSPAATVVQTWGPYSGEKEGSMNLDNLDEAMFRAFGQGGGYHLAGVPGTGGVSSTGGGGFKAASGVRPSQNSTYATVPAENPVGAGSSATGSAFPVRFQPASPDHSAHQRQPSYRYPPNEQGIPVYLKENYNPRFETTADAEQGYRGYGYGGYPTQSPARFPRTGYQGVARPPVSRGLPVETTSVYTIQQQPVQTEVYMKDFGAEGSYSYYLKPIPLTGPRFIR